MQVTSEKIQIKQVGKAFLVVVLDTSSARYPTVPCYHTAGVYWSEKDALQLVWLGRFLADVAVLSDDECSCDDSDDEDLDDSYLSRQAARYAHDENYLEGE